MPNVMIATERQVFKRLEAAIQADHRASNLAGLAESYAEGAGLYERQGEIDAACFYWTQAYVLALDAGADQLARTLYEKLDAQGRMAARTSGSQGSCDAGPLPVG
jgi:hypothetical protein